MTLTQTSQSDLISRSEDVRVARQAQEGHCSVNCRLRHCKDIKEKVDLGFWSRWKRKAQVHPGQADADISEARMQLKDLYPDSYIHHEFPERSDGLHTEEARKRLRDGGGNVLPPPKEENLLHVFVRQFHFKFWVLLTGAAFLSIAAYFAHYAQGFNEPLNLY
ncbi:unnamed protein product, partial [Nippostrongylus brasiliensis]|uniref:Cation_ATPase_N domain-containing protein n=1 Tax=Nippostrongylus brasiliensis TaxID=27835 RepID=A0A0N4XFT3_NIPBR